MIVGIGSDLCSIERIEKSLARWGDKFLNRVFTETERAKAASRPHTRAGTLAKRFAASEACSNAVGTGFQRGVVRKDIGVVYAPSGAWAASILTEPTGSSMSEIDWLTIEPAATFRRSTSTVSGSGWLVR